MKKEKLSPQLDNFSIALAMQIYVDVYKSAYKVKRTKKLDDYFSFNMDFLNLSVMSVLGQITYFIEDGLILEFVATIDNSLDEDEEYRVIEVKKWDKSNLPTVALPALNIDCPLPLICQPELDELEQKNRWLSYEMKVDLDRITEWLDLRLSLLKANKFSQQAYKYERQRELVLDRIDQLLTDLVPENLKIYQLEPVDQIFFNLIMYDLHREGLLEIKEVKPFQIETSEIGKDNDRSVFTVDVLKAGSISGSVSEFDKVLSLLKIHNLELKIKKESQQYYLLDAVFDDPSKLWHFSELKEVIDGEDDLENWKKWYNVTRAIEGKIAVRSKGEYEDFFVTTTKSIQVNPKYL